jgi:hypothetical protein
MIGGHVKVRLSPIFPVSHLSNNAVSQYVQGAVSSALGYESGNQTKEAAVQEMRDAKEQSDNSQPTQSSILGTVENLAGKATGCEGMVEEGGKRIPEKRGIEEQSGTG